MKLSLAGVVVLALGAAALAGCSSGNEPVTSTGAGSTSLPGITTRGLGTVTRTPNAVTVVIGVQTRAQSAKAPLMPTPERRPR